jgi:hypothetical protein
MLRSLKDLERYTVSATDGDIGRVLDFLFDDERWTVRYLVVDTEGGFFEFNGRRVLISPISFRKAEWLTRHFRLSLTRAKVTTSPSVDVDQPVSRQHEAELNRHYGFTPYWGYSGIWGMGTFPSMLAAGEWSEPQPERSDDVPGDAHLRSIREICGYHIEGTDDAIGHVDDFIVDDESWAIRYLAVDTSNGWFGKKVLVAPHCARRIDWTAKKVHVNLSRQALQHSPEWNPKAAINRELEARLYDYYGRPVYWDGGDSAGPAQQHPG